MFPCMKIYIFFSYEEERGRGTKLLDRNLVPPKVFCLSHKERSCDVVFYVWVCVCVKTQERN